MAVTSLANEAVAIGEWAVFLWRKSKRSGSGSGRRKTRTSGLDWGVHVLFILSVGLEVSRQFLLMV